MRTISQASSSLLTVLPPAYRALHVMLLTLWKIALRRRVVTVNSIHDLNRHQMRDLDADLEGESIRYNPAFRAFEQERILNEAKQKALLFTVGMGGR